MSAIVREMLFLQAVKLTDQELLDFTVDCLHQLQARGLVDVTIDGGAIPIMPECWRRVAEPPLVTVVCSRIRVAWRRWLGPAVLVVGSILAFKYVLPAALTYLGGGSY